MTKKESPRENPRAQRIPTGVASVRALRVACTGVARNAPTAFSDYLSQTSDYLSQTFYFSALTLHRNLERARIEKEIRLKIIDKVTINN
ncbi:hypothetical protein FACS189426_23660 [Bacteroidia bacterium]|nr:hypothetical protein FACS189426_23660 [Bacteroidia bacterium]GHT85712.1 hypothetical protein FACS18947_4810 [Bacteroidia bacterium]